MTSKVRVRFTKHWSLYNAGDTAGFSPDEAAAIVKAEAAVPDGPEAEAILSRMESKSVLDGAVTRDAEPTTRAVTTEDTVSNPRRRR